VGEVDWQAASWFSVSYAVKEAGQQPSEWTRPLVLGKDGMLKMKLLYFT
jgi:hypothetical protein